VDQVEDQVEEVTAREREVLLLVAAGKRNDEIAADLCIVPKTVETHLHNIFGKLGVKSRLQAVNRARELGIIP
jgi:LuxR family maltose regulon positive regulatory protein